MKGMEMPKTCGDCNFLHESMWKGKIYPCVCSAGGFVVKPSETDLRDGLCPLTEVKTPHGRLIDRNEIRPPEMDTDCDKVRMVSALAATPTVIQEEG